MRTGQVFREALLILDGGDGVQVPWLPEVSTEFYACRIPWYLHNSSSMNLYLKPYFWYKYASISGADLTKLYFMTIGIVYYALVIIRSRTIDVGGSQAPDSAQRVARSPW